MIWCRSHIDFRPAEPVGDISFTTVKVSIMEYLAWAASDQVGLPRCWSRHVTTFNWMLGSGFLEGPCGVWKKQHRIHAKCSHLVVMFFCSRHWEAVWQFKMCSVDGCVLHSLRVCCQFHLASFVKPCPGGLQCFKGRGTRGSISTESGINGWVKEAIVYLRFRTRIQTSY